MLSLDPICSGAAPWPKNKEKTIKNTCEVEFRWYRDRAEPTEHNGLSAPLTDDPETYHTDRKPMLGLAHIREGVP